MANLKKIAAFGAAFLGGCLLGGAAGIYGEKKYQVSEKFSKKQEVNTPSAEVVMAQQTSQPANNNKPVMNNNNGHSNQPQQQK